MIKKIFSLGQSVLEYAVIVSVVVAALSAMSVYLQRSVQAQLKIIEDRASTDSAVK